jgi:tol-pal system protein YbgF
MRLHAPSVGVLGLLVPLVLAGTVAGSTGCARSAEERQLESMQADIENIQRDRDGVDPPQLGPDGVPVKAAAPAAVPSAGASPPVPPAEAVHVGATDDAIADDYADPEDTTPRPAIRVAGASRGRRGGDETFDTPAEESSAPRPLLLDPEAKRAYDAALALVNARQFGKGIDALAAFLVKWPDHPYADRAMFWRGECYFAQGDYPRASEELSGLLARFPASSKAPDALLKLGVCDQKLGHLAEAKECFDRLVHDFPQADAARRIPSITVPASPSSGPAEDHR